MQGCVQSLRSAIIPAVKYTPLHLRYTRVAYLRTTIYRRNRDGLPDLHFYTPIHYGKAFSTCPPILLESNSLLCFSTIDASVEWIYCDYSTFDFKYKKKRNHEKILNILRYNWQGADENVSENIENALDWFHFKSCNEVCMRSSEYFGMKVCYSTLKMKKHVFHRLAEIFFFQEWWAVEDNLTIS